MRRHLSRSISASDQTWLTLSSIVLQVTLPPAPLLVCIPPPSLPPSMLDSDGARVIHLHIRQQIDIDTKQSQRERVSE